MAKSWRVYLEKNELGLCLLALDNSFLEASEHLSQPTPQALQSGHMVFLQNPALNPQALIAELEIIIPSNDQIHILTAYEAFSGINSEPLLIRGKKLIVISRASLTAEYARVDRIHREIQQNLERAQSQQFENFKTQNLQKPRKTLELFRRAYKNPIQWKLIEKIFGDLPDFADLKSRAATKAKMLLHVCCGPDAGGVIQQLKNEFDLTCFWYDPNIQPREEHDKRQEAFEKVARIESVPAVIGEYDVERFFESIKGLEHTPEQGAKCSNCYDLRLERSAQEASRGEFDYYATTLAISPHKVQQKLIAFGELNEKKYQVPYYHRNFMKEDGFNDSVRYSVENEIFRQDYCGCIYSLKDGGPDARAQSTRLFG